MKFLLLALVLNFSSWAICTKGESTYNSTKKDDLAFLFSGGSVGTGGSGDESLFTVGDRLIRAGYHNLSMFFSENGDALSKVFSVEPSEVVKAIQKADKNIQFCHGEELRDVDGVKRTAINYIDQAGNYNIKFNLDKLRDELAQIKNVEYRAAAFYVLITHEIFDLLGIEVNKPENEFLIDGYGESRFMADYIVKVIGFGLSINGTGLTDCTLEYPYLYNYNKYTDATLMMLEKSFETSKHFFHNLGNFDVISKDFPKWLREVEETAEILINKGYSLHRPIYKPVEMKMKGQRFDYEYVSQSKNSENYLGEKSNARFEVRLNTDSYLFKSYSFFQRNLVSINEVYIYDNNSKSSYYRFENQAVMEKAFYSLKLKQEENKKISEPDQLNAISKEYNLTLFHDERVNHLYGDVHFKMREIDSCYQ